MNITPNRAAIIGLTFFIVYLELKCPCARLMECSLGKFAAAGTAIGLLMLYEYK